VEACEQLLAQAKRRERYGAEPLTSKNSFLRALDNVQWVYEDSMRLVETEPASCSHPYCVEPVVECGTTCEGHRPMRPKLSVVK